MRDNRGVGGPEGKALKMTHVKALGRLLRKRAGAGMALDGGVRVEDTADVLDHADGGVILRSPQIDADDNRVDLGRKTPTAAAGVVAVGAAMAVVSSTEASHHVRTPRR